MTETPMTTPPEEPRLLGMPARWARRVLVISLVLNFAIVGLIAGAAIRHHDHQAFGPGMMTLRHVMRHLPEDREATAKARLAERGGELRAARDARREARRAMAAALSADSFDGAAMEVAIDQFRDAQTQIGAITGDLFVAMAGEMTAKERARLVKWMQRRRDRGEKRAREE